MPFDPTLKSIPQYPQGTPAEARLLEMLLKSTYEHSKAFVDQMRSSFRVSEYLIANVNEIYGVKLEGHDDDQAYVIRTTKNQPITLALMCRKMETQFSVQEYVNIAALNISAATIKRICEENNMLFTGVKRFNNVVVYSFNHQLVDGYHTCLKISVGTELHDYHQERSKL